MCLEYVSAELNELGVISRHTEACGPLPGHNQNVHAAELFSFLFYLQHAVAHEGFYDLFCDCTDVVAGKHANTHGWVVDADLWALMFKRSTTSAEKAS